MAMAAPPKLESSRNREYSRDAFARMGMAIASVRVAVGPPPAVTITRQAITATIGSGALSPRAKTAAGMQASYRARRGPVKMSPMCPQAGRANE